MINTCFVQGCAVGTAKQNVTLHEFPKELIIVMICVTKSRTGNYNFRACADARDFPGSTRFGRTHTLRCVCRAITR